MSLRREEEADLEAAGHIYDLQIARFLDFQTSSSSQLFDIDGLLITEAKMRENTQREVALKHQLAIFKKKVKYKLPFFKSICIDAHLFDETFALGEHYWFLERRWARIKASLGDIPFSRGIDLWRSDPRWYMHRALREDCATKGGCCGRMCGCCLRRENLEKPFAGGHCTVECYCCKKTQGRQSGLQRLRHLHHQQQDERGLASGLQKNEISNQIRYASLLGLMPGSNDNPFNLIDDVHVQYGRPLSINGHVFKRSSRSEALGISHTFPSREYQV
ncbi:hypothetical protein N7468_002242 [Penicillium chermesinum]|uniref:Uncharacterized protein n=1 Tax=Penicillium chermesinum TaxID=63820 RepID=A0A9W9PID7_9EURO|nr:uncharacterized protein N7468_002242 [Penicillium chermesinum]KAJ5247259.1 hypothetical protein N7468_002242 [Penicillium chermesinum]KAJ6145501.1 hypothetical protein N7470_009396 [Penicillium chermesinum]